ncbi:pyridoxamine 5'-phosphate oxidase family protein [Pseudonocardia bannensis]|uniref:Pyridoxamine 5'-phosphate oxidase family protein n=1 Tax=Pseudonocardia bannensis TaxID=630973 RepID=A0A848DF44_9PSEU|nr:pyridoxamine 5'-phosphate oxidase family protein [Pseudonocardia bannensis]NMH91195.1 pyridoxamine 5'-phosphate oxidase family protein [Pseudonocardia bannensis]
MNKGPGSPDERPLETLDRDACLALLSTVAIGRVAWATSTGAVVVLPVNFVLDGETIVFSTGPGEKLTAVREGRQVSFEADDVEEAIHTGWSVLITGTAEVVDDPEQAHRIERLHLETWAPGSGRLFIRLPVEEVTGRRLPLRPGRVTIERLDR